jgi:hypothetical protein
MLKNILLNVIYGNQDHQRKQININRKNSTMRTYCDQYLTGKHIWTSIHHPQTMDTFKCSEGVEEIFSAQTGKSLY